MAARAVGTAVTVLEHVATPQTGTAKRAAQPVARARAAGRDVAADAFLSQVFNDYVASDAPLWRYAAQRPGLVLRTARALTHLPVLSVDLPHGEEAAAVSRMLLDHAGSRRAMLGVAAVVRTPYRPGTFAEGPERGTLRRKMRAATKQGVTIRPVPVEARPALLELARQHELENEREEYRNPSPVVDDLLDYDLWLAAYDADDRPVMLAVIPCCGEWAVLRYFRTLVAGQASSDARYLMSEVLAETLGGLGIRHLVDSSRPHWLPNGLRHFQRMVGFRLVRLRGIRTPRS